MLNRKDKVYEKRANGTLRVATKNEQPSMTQSQFKDQCDINIIMKQYQKTGELTHLNKKTGAYADLSELPSYQEALNTVMEAENSFMTIPSSIRKKFDNDPQQLIDFLADKSNDEEAIRLGLKIRPPSPTPTPIIQNEPNEPKTKTKTKAQNDET